jgi:predicted O-methyltransferase YrrM
MIESLRSLLHELERFGMENDAGAASRQQKMLNITPETGELLALLVLAMKARRILEVGTSNGYSTLWLADAVRAIGGCVVTVEVAPAKAEMARHNIERAGLSRWICQEVMDAGEFLCRHAPAAFDLLFLDADRGQYAGWWPWLEKIIAPGGLLVVDNAISHAHEMAGFTRQVHAAPGWRAMTIPVGNGELVALKPLA